MNENVDSMMIRLVGLALAVLMMAGMTIYTDLFKKTSGMDARAAVISVQDGHVAAEDVQWNARDKLFFKHNTAPRSSLLRGAVFVYAFIASAASGGS